MTIASEQLGARLRQLLPAGMEEKRMFGGLGFLIGGNMAVGTTAGGDLLVRVDAAGTSSLLSRPGAYQMMMGERPMKGFLAVAATALSSDSTLREWADAGIAYARTLPAK